MLLLCISMTNNDEAGQDGHSAVQSMDANKRTQGLQGHSHPPIGIALTAHCASDRMDLVPRTDTRSTGIHPSALRHTQPRGHDTSHPTPTCQQCKDAKESTLQAISNRQSPLLFAFNIISHDLQ
jgi:hypothetical protein